MVMQLYECKEKLLRKMYPFEFYAMERKGQRKWKKTKIKQSHEDKKKM